MELIRYIIAGIPAMDFRHALFTSWLIGEGIAKIAQVIGWVLAHASMRDTGEVRRSFIADVFNISFLRLLYLAITVGPAGCLFPVSRHEYAPIIWTRAVSFWLLIVTTVSGTVLFWAL